MKKLIDIKDYLSKDYLSHEEIKEIIADSTKQAISSMLRNEDNIQRLMTNAVYLALFEQADEESIKRREHIVKKTNELIPELKGSAIFRFHYLTGEPQSYAARLIDEVVKENKEIIVKRILDTAANHDYSSQVWRSIESCFDNIKNLTENLGSAIGDLFHCVGRKKDEGNKTN